MTYAAFQKEQKKYLEKVTAQGRTDGIPRFSEIFYGDDYTVKLLDSDGIQERLDLMRADAEIRGNAFDEKTEKGRLIGEAVGDLTKEAKLEYDKFIPTKDPDGLLKNLDAFYRRMTGRDVVADCETDAGRKEIERLLGRASEKASVVEKAAALTAVRKIPFMLENQDLRNTNTSAGYHIVTVENKAANPYGFYMSRIATLPRETRDALTAHADKLLPVTHDGAAWHEMTHALGTDDESKCEGFRFLKTLQKYKEPVLILPDVNARLHNNLCTLETIRRDSRQGRRTLNGNFRYIMPKMMRHIVENADRLRDETVKMTDAQVMEKTKEIVGKCAYDKKTEEAFRGLAKTCDSPSALAQMMRDAYKNGAKHPKTGAIYPLVDDFVEMAVCLNPGVPKRELVERFFSAENFVSESRNAGKVEIARRDETLSATDRERYQDLYDRTKRENPQAAGDDLKALFAKNIVRSAWAEKAAIEAEAEHSATAGKILFDKTVAAGNTGRINACLSRARNASGIVEKYGRDFEAGIFRRARKIGLQRKIAEAGKAAQKRIAIARLKSERSK